jgi:hypothetical protein
MTNRIPVSTIENKWVDAHKVTSNDLILEQQHYDLNNAAVVQNFFGSGVLLETPTANILFDTDDLSVLQAQLQAANNLDGTGLDPKTQPSDTLLGNQLAVTYDDSSILQYTRYSEARAFGRNSVKVLIIGLDFEGNLQYDRFSFHKKETQLTKKHYTKILTIILNDFDGNNNCSSCWGGRISIREALPFELNRDAIMVSQDVEPNIFIRDFNPADCNKSIYDMIQEGIGSEYDADNLQINITGRQPMRVIEANDITTQIGQKFYTENNNIQKVTLLLAVSVDDDGYIENKYDWTGDLVVSIYRLQTTTSCPTDIVPDLAIDFDPEERPISELSFSQEELKDAGYVLTDVPQPVDFVFTNSAISQVGGIELGKYHVICVRRSGNANVGNIYLEVGNDRTSQSRLTIFNGIWVDVPEEDLWFQIWSDSAKISTGQAYDNGYGIISPKTISSYNTTIDNYDDHLDFISTGQNVKNTAILQASVEESIQIQDERTGSKVYSRKQTVPSFSFVTSAALDTLKQTSEPLILGCMADINPKVITTIEKTQNYVGMASGDKYTIINPDPDLLAIRLIGRKLIPQVDCNSFEYRIFKSKICVDGYGDVNGDGQITQEDVIRAAELIGSSLDNITTQEEILNGEKTTLEILRADVDGDGIVSADDVDRIQKFVNRIDGYRSFPIGTSFTHLELQVQPAVGRWDGYWNCGCQNEITQDGYIKIQGGCTPTLIDPSSLTEIERIYYGNNFIPSIDSDIPGVYQVAPFVPVNYQIKFNGFWQEWLLSLTSDARAVPAAFTYANSLTSNACDDPLTFRCGETENQTQDCNPGRNDFYVPGNLIIGTGDLVRPDGSPIHSDIEIGIINFELGNQVFEETTFDIFRDLVADRGDGFTNANYPAMKYADCSTVKPEDLAGNRVRFNVAIQSFVPSLDGYTGEDGYGIIVDDIVGVYMNHELGILKLTIKDLDDNPLYKTLVSKIQIVVSLKKAGWRNNVLNITSDEVAGLGTSSPIS